MSIEIVKDYLAGFGLAERVIEFQESSATVEEAARDLGCEPARIAKTMAFQGPDGAFLVVLAGDARVDNPRFKAQFHTKASMVKPEDLVAQVGHPMGGVCPFALRPGVPVYLDESLRAFDPVYPAAGAPNNAVELHLDELEGLTGGQWVDVCKSPEPADA